ncbi:MAG: Lrp/AsnC ligand binding domain-containing protein, partial [Nitrososphaeraceae archaeon]
LRIEEVLEMHEMHGKFDLLLKIRAKNLNQMRDIVENKICKISHIFKAELMTVLKTKKEEQMISLENDSEYKDMLYLNEDHLKSSSFSSLSLVRVK